MRGMNWDDVHEHSQDELANQRETTELSSDSFFRILNDLQFSLRTWVTTYRSRCWCQAWWPAPDNVVNYEVRPSCCWEGDRYRRAEGCTDTCVDLKLVIVVEMNHARFQKGDRGSEPTGKLAVAGFLRNTGTDPLEKQLELIASRRRSVRLIVIKYVDD